MSALAPGRFLSVVGTVSAEEQRKQLFGEERDGPGPAAEGASPPPPPPPATGSEPEGAGKKRQ